MAGRMKPAMPSTDRLPLPVRRIVPDRKMLL
jgi:hypothetical protein